MVYGRIPNTALENELCWPEEAPEPYETFLQRVQAVRESVRLRIVEKQKKVKAFVDSRRRVVRDLCPGELVLVRRNLSKKGKTKKFLPKFIGPFQVVRKVCPTTYLVEDLPHNRKKKEWRRFRAHVCQIRKFRAREPDWGSEDEEEPDDTPPLPVVLPHPPQVHPLPAEDPPVPVEDPPRPDEDPPDPPQSIPPPILTRSGRTSKPPTWHREYVR